jgi:hypothetical protein
MGIEVAAPEAQWQQDEPALVNVHPPLAGEGKAQVEGKCQNEELRPGAA